MASEKWDPCRGALGDLWAGGCTVQGCPCFALSSSTRLTGTSTVNQFVLHAQGGPRAA